MTGSTGPSVPAAVALRAVLDEVPSYVAGQPPAADEVLTPFKLSSNENPYPPLPSVVEALQRAATVVNRYPDMGVQAPIAAIAEHLDVEPDSLALGTGSVAVLGHILAAACEAGDEVVYAWRSFEAYPIVVKLAGASPVPIALTADHGHDLAAMRAAVGERTKVVLLCTPNNPTGAALTHTQVAEFVADVPPNVLVIIDEAYCEFVRGQDPLDAGALAERHANVVVLRTFSKAYGLAGLRVGYCRAHPDIARGVRKACTPFGVNSLAQVAVVASLQVGHELAERVEAITRERERVVTGLRASGWQIPDTQANFVWLPLGEQTDEFAARCARRALSVRPFSGEGVRVTVGETEANDRFLEVAADFMAERERS